MSAQIVITAVTLAVAPFIGWLFAELLKTCNLVSNTFRLLALGAVVIALTIIVLVYYPHLAPAFAVAAMIGLKDGRRTDAASEAAYRRSAMSQETGFQLTQSDDPFARRSPVESAPTRTVFGRRKPQVRLTPLGEVKMAVVNDSPAPRPRRRGHLRVVK